MDGYRIHNVIQYTDTVITIYFSIVILSLIFFIFKYRTRPGHTEFYDKGDSKNMVWPSSGWYYLNNNYGLIIM